MFSVVFVCLSVCLSVYGVGLVGWDLISGPHPTPPGSVRKTRRTKQEGLEEELVRKDPDHGWYCLVMLMGSYLVAIMIIY